MRRKVTAESILSKIGLNVVLSLSEHKTGKYQGVSWCLETLLNHLGS